MIRGVERVEGRGGGERQHNKGSDGEVTECGKAANCITHLLIKALHVRHLH
jgi:hypothetical protein